MKEQQFLTDAENFIEWLTNRLDEGGLNHQWVSRSGKTGVPKDKTWACTSLYVAYKQYVWPATCPSTGDKVMTFSETLVCLEELRTRLLAAMRVDDAKACEVLCCQILEWGGVAHRPNIARRVKILGPELAAYLGAIQSHFQRSDLDAEDVEVEVCVGKKHIPIELDSGTTKIYSLICPEFVIYDGRVGAALGHLVARWNQDAHQGRQEAIPTSLWFAWGDRSKKTRDPIPSGFPREMFPLLRNDDGSRIGHNLRANWLCKKLAQESRGTRFEELGDVADRMRAIEAALFMIGYAVN